MPLSVLALSMGVRHITGWARQRATRPGRLHHEAESVLTE
jgi:hypothetical protein